MSSCQAHDLPFARASPHILPTGQRSGTRVRAQDARTSDVRLHLVVDPPRGCPRIRSDVCGL